MKIETKNHEFNRIYHDYKNLILKIAYQYTKNYQVAQDITQDVFMALYKDMDQKTEMAEYKNIKNWLFTTTKHQSLNYIKKYSRECNYPQDNQMEYMDVEVKESPEDSYLHEITEEERKNLHERIMVDLLKKNDRWYDAITLVGCLEVSQVEAAKIMGMNQDAFYVLLHRIRVWINKTYGIEYDELKET